MTYELGRAQSAQRVLGLRPAQAVALAASVLAATVLVPRGGGARVLGVLLAVGLFALGVARMRGRGLDQWALVLCAFVARGHRGALDAGSHVEAVVEDGVEFGVLRSSSAAVTLVEIVPTGLRALSAEPDALPRSLTSWLAHVAQRGDAPIVHLITSTTRTDEGLEVHSYVAVRGPDPQRDVRSLLSQLDGVAVPCDARRLEEVLGSVLLDRTESVLAAELHEHISHLDAGGSLLACFGIARLPEQAADDQFLAPIVLGGTRRVLCIALRLEPAHLAHRRVQRSRTLAGAEHELQRRGGFLDDAREQRRARSDSRRAEQHAAGHAGVRALGIIVIEARDRSGLERAAEQLELDAQRASIELVRLDGEHLGALRCALALGAHP